MDLHDEPDSARPSDPDARLEPNELVERHLHLVQQVVNRLAAGYPRHIDRSELWSAGAAGLVDASRRFDPSAGVPFERYAVIRIRGAVVDSTRTRDWASRRLRRDLRTLAGEIERFEEAHGRSPTDDELAAAVHLSVGEVRDRRAAGARVTLLHLDQPLAGAEGSTFGETIAEQVEDRLPDEALEQRELIGTLRTAVEHLPPAQREVVERHFFGGELLREIAVSLGVTEARVSQIRSEALNAVRAYFSSSFEEVPPVPDSAPGVRRRAAYVAAVRARSGWRGRLDAGLPATRPSPIGSRGPAADPSAGRASA